MYCLHMVAMFNCVYKNWQCIDKNWISVFTDRSCCSYTHALSFQTDKPAAWYVHVCIYKWLISGHVYNTHLYRSYGTTESIKLIRRCWVPSYSQTSTLITILWLSSHGIYLHKLWIVCSIYYHYHQSIGVRLYSWNSSGS